RASDQHVASTRQTSERQDEYYLSYVRYFRKHHRRGSAAILRAAVAASTLARMAALVVKYPPVDRCRTASLIAKEVACVRLLRSLGSAPAVRTRCRPSWSRPAGGAAAARTT